MLIKDLVSIPSQSFEEKRIIDFIIEWFGKLGIEVMIQGENAVVHIPGQRTDRALILNGHVDTVSSGDEADWMFGPYNPVIRNNELFGLGSSDMKAGVAAFMQLAKKFRKKVPPCDLWFSFVVGEEVDGRGTQSFLHWFYNNGYNANYERIEGIISEPTNNEFIGIGHRGNAFIKLTVVGDAGHASAPNNIKRKAVDQVIGLCHEVKDLEEEWQAEYRHDALGVPTIGLTSIRAGELATINCIPSTASIILDVRTTPLLHEHVDTLIKKFVDGTDMNVRYEFLSKSPAGWCSESSIVRSIFSKYYPQLRQESLTGSADQCFFSEKGIACLVFGPGQRHKMHAVNESVVLDSIPRYINTVCDIINKFSQE